MEIQLLCFGVNASNLQGATDEQLKQNSPWQHTHRGSRWSNTHTLCYYDRYFILWLEAEHQVRVDGFIKKTSRLLNSCGSVSSFTAKIAF